MLSYKYCTCQVRFETNLEVIGGAGVSGVESFQFLVLVVSGGKGRVGTEIRKKRACDRRPEPNP
jgi:hypothetical protein